ncbi:MAG TPA: hypothetical protein DHW39_03990 [Erysipelotrichaceae bacterium]|nr:hypothetical protein [Erysipelotrichaceae bacterium]
MTKKKNKLPLSTLVLALTAVCMLVFSGIGLARAALEIFSRQYKSQFEMFDIGISLYEDNEFLKEPMKVSNRDYANKTYTSTLRLEDNWNEESLRLLNGYPENLELGRDYKEVLSVKNSGTIDEYVRVKIYKYWMKTEDGETRKATDLDTSFIDLQWADDLDKYWLRDTANSIGEDNGIEETTVLYYREPLAVGDFTTDITKSLKITYPVSAKITQTVEKVGTKTIYTTKYDYDGVTFVLEAEADGVQTHNAKDAILSAWGRKVTMSNGRITGFEN